MEHLIPSGPSLLLVKFQPGLKRCHVSTARIFQVDARGYTVDSLGGSTPKRTNRKCWLLASDLVLQIVLHSIMSQQQKIIPI